MAQGGIALRAKRILIENGVDKDLAEALAIVLDDIYHSQLSEVATKEDLKLLMEMMDKRFQAMDKRFSDLLHYLDKRFEEVHKRISTAQWIIGFLLTAYIALIGFLLAYVLPRVM